MDIHQMQVRYDPLQDRLLLQIRARGGEMFAVWLTRRLAARFWAPFVEAVAAAPLSGGGMKSMALPEAMELLSQAARERPLPQADFVTPFETQSSSQPLGAQPLLPSAMNLARSPQGGVLLRVQEERGRHLEMRLGDDLAAGLLRLLEKALAASDWGLTTPLAPAEHGDDQPPRHARVLN